MLDLSGLTFMDCAGLRVILCMDAQSSDRPGRFLVRRGSRERIDRVFSLTERRPTALVHLMAQPSVAIVGGGFGGIGAAVMLSARATTT